MHEKARSCEKVSDVELRRLHWSCRRGLLELDLALTRFLERHARGLSAADLAILNGLLELDDNALWRLISSREEDLPECPAAVEAVLRRLRED